MKKYLFLISITLLFACCKDKPIVEPENITTIDLTFTDNFSHEPVKDLTLKLAEFDVDVYNNVINKVYLGTYYTDANGKFYLEVKNLNKNKSHGVEWKKPSECYEEYNYGIKVGEKNVYSRTLISSASILFHIKNMNPFDENDEFYFCYDSQRDVNPYCFEANPSIGMNIDAHLLQNQYGNMKFFIHWKVIKNAVVTTYLDSLTTNPCEITEFNIFY
jgi:hypothetical protein